MSLQIKTQLLATAEAFGPYRIYHLSRGLTLDIKAREAYVRGGPQLYKTYKISSELSDTEIPADAITYDALVRQIETEIGVKVVAFTLKTPLRRELGCEDYGTLSKSNGVLPPDEAVFRLSHHCIGAGELAEELLCRFQSLDFYCRVLLSEQAHGNFSVQAMEQCAAIKEGIYAGHFSPKDLDDLTEKVKQLGYPIEKAFFLSNARSLAEDMRGALLRACYHFSNMTKNLWLVNQNVVVDSPIYQNTLLQKTNSIRELEHSSPTADRVSDEFTSSVIACYTTLELLYELFVYLIREPFGTPNYPKGLHFPDENPKAAFREGATIFPDDLPLSDAPLAIPNLPANRFTSLRRLRNDLAHNMAADEIRARIFVGVGYLPVNNYELQYAQYLTRDIDVNGTPIQHSWSRRFYQQQRDAQHVVHDWLIDTWQCVFDTVDWLIHRLKNKAKNVGFLDESMM